MMSEFDVFLYLFSGSVDFIICIYYQKGVKYIRNIDNKVKIHA